MNFKELKELIEIVASTENIEELEVERSGVRLRIKRSSNHVSTALSNVGAVSEGPSDADACPGADSR